MARVEIFPNREALACAAVGHLIQQGQETIRGDGSFSLVLSGGSTPLGIYERLAQPELVSQLDWRRVHLFWGDERCVPPDDPESNYGMARQALLSKIPIPEENIHRMRGEERPEIAALEYETEIRSFFEKRRRYDQGFAEAFDLVLLGLGEDGHTASLFPGSPAVNEQVNWVAAVEHNQPPPPILPRLTLTLPAINAARQVVFIVSGESKAAILSRVVGGEEHPPLPAQCVQPGPGRLLWLVDRSAALKLPFR